jgi:phosphohistidine phosphatase SixA
MRIRILLLLLLTGCVANTNVGSPDAVYTLYLVRHAEKQAGGGSDPFLTPAGINRSEQLAAWLQDKDIRDIWSSDYNRSRATAGPLVSGTGLALSLYDPRDLPALAGDLLDRRRNALVVGHSNTTPELARLLCRCVIADMDESEYDRLIVISMTDGQAKVETLTQNTLFTVPAGS